MLDNKTLLITGASHGIGKATAIRCHQLGAQLMLHGRDSEALHQLKSELGGRVEIKALDLIEASAAKVLVGETIERFGTVDGLVNNAGIFPRTRLEDINDEVYDRIMNVNTKAPLFLCYELIKHLKAQKKPGSIVNIGSINAYCGQEDLVIYSMSKGALMTMTRNLADGHARDGIRINQLNVGWTATETEIALKTKELGENWQRHIPLTYAPRAELLKPSEIASHVAFWLSELSAPTTGAVYELEQYPIIGRNRISDLSL